MDIFATVLSVAQLVKVAAEKAIEFKNAPRNMRELVRKAEASLIFLDRIDDLFKGLPDSERTDTRRIVIPAMEKYGEFLKDLLDRLQIKQEGRYDVLKKRVRWVCWEKKELEGRLKTLEEYETFFNRFITTFVAEDSRDTGLRLEMIRPIVEKIRDVTDYSRFNTCLQGLPQDISDRDKMDEQLRKAQHSLPSWVLKNTPFRSWIEPPNPDSSTWLWALGKAGTGKTCIASFVADQLQSTDLALSSGMELPGNPGGLSDSEPDIRNLNLDGSSANVATVLFYCSYQKDMEQKQKPGHIFRCFIRQLMEQMWLTSPLSARKHIDGVERLLSGRSEPGVQRPTPQGTFEVLTSEFTTTFLIVDALDENDAEADEILRLLKSLKSKSVRVMVTSRTGMRWQELAANMNDCVLDVEASVPYLDVDQNADTIRLFVVNTLDLLVKGDLSVTHSRHKPLAALAATPGRLEVIANSIIDAASGNFFAAELYIQAIKSMHAETTSSLEHALNRLTTGGLGLNKLVAEAIDRVEKQEGEDAEIGKTVLLWAIYARGTLEVSEIQYAVAYTRSGGRRRRDRRRAIEDEAQDYTPRKLSETTCYFLHFEHKFTRVQVHKAVRDFCDDEGRENLYFPDAHTKMAKACLDCLASSDLRCRTKDDWYKLVSESPLLRYAAQNWGWHMRKGKEDSLKDSLRARLQSSAFLNSMAIATQPTWERMGVWDNHMWELLRNEDEDEPIFHALHFLALDDLEETAEEWLKSHPEDVDKPTRHASTSTKNHTQSVLIHAGFSPLHVASLVNAEGVAEVLTNQGADLARYNGEGKMTALAAAASRGANEVADILLEDNRRARELVQQEDGLKRRPLAIAAAHGSLKVVELILNVFPKSRDQHQMLFQVDSKRWTALHWAAQGNHSHVINRIIKAAGPRTHELLEQRSLSEGASDTALHLAALGGSQDAVQALLNAGADASARQAQGKTPLQLAMQIPYTSSADVVKLLLPQTDLSSRDESGEHVLHSAASHHQPLYIETLLQNMSRELILAQRADGATTLLIAAQQADGDWSSHFIHALGLLIKAMDREIDVVEAREVLKIVLRHREVTVLQILLQSFNDPRVLTEGTTTTLLREAIKTDSKGIVEQVVLRYGPQDLDVRNPFGQTPLVEAAGRRATEVVEYLMSLGANVNAQGGAGRTALHWAVELQLVDMARLILNSKHQPDLTLKDRWGMTALARASARNPCRQLLLADSASATGRTISCLHTLRSDCRIVRGDEHTWVPPQEKLLGTFRGNYLTTDPLPNDVKLPVSRIHISVTGRDQGWSDWSNQYPWDRGTFSPSNTWYELNIERDGAFVHSVPFTGTKLHATDSRGGGLTYGAVWEWDAAEGREPTWPDSTSRTTRPGGRQEERDFVHALRQGDRLVLVARTQWRGWLCITERAEIEVFYED